ncbi:CPBP family intramembrane glutamic endopeptidase [Olivibacter sitiensis]|uniref:CPBP family intramembrane glutamic endopeptidase n=1 Tax=Olivibacter sitiensis TaxID=376470 RepID=UPI0006865F22|nr:CPBP family intramembrane glutamic endopeptidase [Olivibacter sitiensis]
MSSYTRKYPENHPLVSLLQLLALTALSLIVFSVIGLAIIFFLYGLDAMKLNMVQPTERDVEVFRILQITQSIGLFVLPPLLLRYLERKSTFYFDLHAPRYASLWLYASAMMLIAIPTWDLLGRWNAGIALPESLKSVEVWMQEKEEQAKILTEAFLQTKTWSGLIGNIFMIAVLAAVGEEFFFRGILQNALVRWFKNPHVAIWVTAIIFSAIHLQFYGFLPRMFLGALLGYLYWWSNCIWLPILAHFVNNGYAVIASFVLIKQGKNLDAVDYGEQTPYYIYIFSVLALGYFLYRFYQYALLERQLEQDNTDGKRLD